MWLTLHSPVALQSLDTFSLHRSPYHPSTCDVWKILLDSFKSNSVKINCADEANANHNLNENTNNMVDIYLARLICSIEACCLLFKISLSLYSPKAEQSCLENSSHVCPEFFSTMWKLLQLLEKIFQFKTGSNWQWQCCASHFGLKSNKLDKSISAGLLLLEMASSSYCIFLFVYLLFVAFVHL